MFIPPAMLYAVEKLNMMPGNFYLKTLLELTIITGELYLEAPLSTAIYPQQHQISTEELEP